MSDGTRDAILLIACLVGAWAVTLAVAAFLIRRREP